VALQPARVLQSVSDGRATIKEVQEAAGHKTVSISAQYSHLSPSHKQSVVQKFSIASKEGK
jgi:hypothetical protein